MRRSRCFRCGTQLAPPRVLQRLRGEYAVTPCSDIHQERRTESTKALRFRHPHRHAKAIHEHFLDADDQ
jgi:hypothetical protein